MGIPRQGRLRTTAFVLAGVALWGSLISGGSPRANARPSRILATPTPQPQAAVIPVTVIPAARAAAALRTLFPHARIRVDTHANAVLVVAAPEDVQQMRNVVAGIDVRNPRAPAVEVLQLHTLKPNDIIPRLRALYPSARIQSASNHALVLRADTADITDIKSLVSSLDVAAPSISPTPMSEDSVRVVQANPRRVARTLVREVPDLHASVSGGTILLSGTQDAIEKAKSLAANLDEPALGSKYTQVYRLHNVDAASVGDLIRRSYPNIALTVDKDLNALSVDATAAQQQRIALAIDQLDAAQTAGGTSGTPAYSGGNVEVVELQSALPGQNGQSSDTAQNIAQAVTQGLGQMAPDLHVTTVPGRPEIILAGNPSSIRLARDLITQLDKPQPLVVLDTEVLEVTESGTRDLGLALSPNQPFIDVNFGEVSPDGYGGGNGFIMPSTGLQKFGRSPINVGLVLNMLVQNGRARVLADPRITTVSGQTAHIQAGDQINVLTKSGGGITPVTEQLQQFTTGVTLDITPIVSANDMVSVALHPQVNSEVPSAGSEVPDIATRDTSTVVQLQDNQTLVIGGLIQDTTQHSVSKIPLLGDLPFVGRFFRGVDDEHVRNELVIVVTPHIIRPKGVSAATNVSEPPPTAVIGIPTPAPLPTLPPGTRLPSMALPSPHAEPTPRTVPTPPSPSIPTPQASMTPAPAPTAFDNTNVFVYGSPPSNTYAPNTQRPQIFYAQFAPTVLRNGTPVQVFAITTTNVARVVIGYPGYWVSLSQAGPSKWQGAFAFNTGGLFAGQSPINIQLNAYRTDGTSASVQIPISLLPH